MWYFPTSVTEIDNLSLAFVFHLNVNHCSLPPENTNHTKSLQTVRASAEPTRVASWHQDLVLCWHVNATQSLQSEHRKRNILSAFGVICTRSNGAEYLILPLCDLQTCRMSSHHGRNGFSPHKKVPVQSHNSFLDQRSRKVIVWFHRNHFCAVWEPCHLTLTWPEVGVRLCELRYWMILALINILVHSQGCWQREFLAKSAWKIRSGADDSWETRFLASSIWLARLYGSGSAEIAVFHLSSLHLRHKANRLVNRLVPVSWEFGNSNSVLLTHFRIHNVSGLEIFTANTTIAKSEESILFYFSPPRVEIGRPGFPKTPPALVLPSVWRRTKCTFFFGDWASQEMIPAFPSQNYTQSLADGWKTFQLHCIFRALWHLSVIWGNLANNLLACCSHIAT